MQNALYEAIKELLRIVLLAVIPVLIAGLDAETGMVAINWQIVGVVALIALLRAVDRWLHKWGKQTGSESLAKGLVRF